MMDAKVEGSSSLVGESRAKSAAGAGAALSILLAISLGHGLNDLMQSLLPAIYPVLQKSYGLDYGQIGLITLTFQITASLLQPVVGLATDRKPQPYSLPFAMVTTMVGLVMLAWSTSFPMLLASAATVGIGSSIFHPEASRVARMASGGRHGLAQSVFQVGGNLGQAVGPLLAAFIVVPRGQGSILWFTLLAFMGMLLLGRVGQWYGAALRVARTQKAATREATSALSRARVVGAVLVLLGLIFSKHFYLAGINTFYTFYLIDKFGLSIQAAQVYLFVFLGAVVLGTIIGGPIGDKFGRKRVIWSSILGVLPFTLALPYADLTWTCVLSVIIGMILASAFPAIVVFAQDLIPGKVGLVGGLFFGFAFGAGGLGAAVLGEVADHTSIAFVFKIIAFLPALGVLTFLLPDIEVRKKNA